MTWSTRFWVVALWLAAIALVALTIHAVRTPRAHVRTESPDARGLSQFSPSAPSARAVRAPAHAQPIPADVRTVQARMLWERLGSHGEFGSYLMDIPQIPDVLRVSNERFPDLVLVDRRPFLQSDGTVKMHEACRVFDVFGCGSPLIRECRDFDPRVAIPAPVYWIRMQEGQRHVNVPPSEARRAFAADEVGATLLEVLSLAIARGSFFPNSIGGDEYWIDAVGTVSASRTADLPTVDATAVASLVERRWWSSASFTVRWKSSSSLARNATRWHHIASANPAIPQTVLR